MMMTNKILIEEVDELKNVFSRGEMEIPSFWSCLWPGVIVAAWNMICALISVGGGYLSVKFIFWVLVFPGVISLIVLLGVASARSLFFYLFPEPIECARRYIGLYLEKLWSMHLCIWL